MSSLPERTGAASRADEGLRAPGLGECANGQNLTISGRRGERGGLTMSALISTAFRLNPGLIIGVPLITDDLVSIRAIMPVGATRDNSPKCCALLEERFHVTTHVQSVEQSGYALTIGKGALQLNKPREIDPFTCSPWTDDPRDSGGKACHARSSEETVAANTDSE